MSISQAPSVPTTDTSSRMPAHGLAPVLIGLLLIAAGLAKTYKMATELPAGNDGPLPSWLVIALAQIELILGVWLVVGLYPRAAKSTALAIFSVFCGVSLYQVLTGEQSCGCFGRIPVNPRYVLLLDFFVVAVLWASSWEGLPSVTVQSNPRRLTAFGIAVVALGALQGAVFLSADGTGPAAATGPGRPVVLRPETWVGQKAPVLDRMDIGHEVAQGHWIVLFYHDNCPHCEDALSRLGELARSHPASREGLQFAAVYVPGPESAGRARAGGLRTARGTWTRERNGSSKPRSASASTAGSLPPLPGVRTS
jgi:hypothetical protein